MQISQRGFRASLPVFFMLTALPFLRCAKDEAAVAADRPRIEVKASVAPLRVTSIVAPIDGRIAVVSAAEGKTVRAGETILTMANSMIDRDLAHARTQRAHIEARMRNPPSRTIAGGDDRLAAASVILRNKQKKLERYRRLFASRDVTEQELNEAENEYAAARRDWSAEKERIAPAATDPQLLQLELERAKADEVVALERKELLTVRSPIDATVLRLHKAVNEVVYTREPLVDLSNTSSVEIRGEIAPELLPYLKAGTPVDLKVLTVPVRRFRQPITRIENTQNAGAAVVVAVPNPDQVLHAGTPALITIE